MPANFNWRDENDLRWSEFAAKEMDPKSRTGQRKWLVIVLIAVIAVSAGLIGHQALQSLVTRAEVGVEDELLSSHELMRDAARRGDSELLTSLVSGADRHWTVAQLALAEQGLLFDRSPFGLSWQGDGRANLVDVSLAPDLLSAVIQVSEMYRFQTGNGQSSQTNLLQTVVYRKSADRWLLSPPKAGFYGETISAEGRYLRIVFPERDGDLGRRLAADLEGILAAICAAPFDLNCPDSYRLSVELVTDPQVLLDLAQPEGPMEIDRALHLPAPSLLGIPVDENGYRAVVRGYAAWAAEAMIADLVAWSCCRHALFQRALLDVQLEQLALRPWPLDASHYRQLLRRPARLDRVADLWRSDLALADLLSSEDGWLAHALVQFLVSEPGAVSAAGMQRALAEAHSFEGWLRKVSGDKVAASGEPFERSWREFLRSKILSFQGPWTIAPPEQDILLMCSSEQAGLSSLYRYDVQSDSWSLDISDRGFAVMDSLPGDEGLLLTEVMHGGNGDWLRTLVWRDGREYVVGDEDVFYFNLIPGGLPEYHLLFVGFSDDMPPEPFMVDLESCENSKCSLERLQGLPVWSPDGRQVLLTVGEQLFRSSHLRQEGKMVGTGLEPFWLTSETYGYLRSTGDEVLILNAQDDTVIDRLGTDDLAALLVETLPYYLKIHSVTAAPTEPVLLYITVADRVREREALFTYEWHSRNLQVVVDLEMAELTPVTVSLDGRQASFYAFHFQRTSDHGLRELFLHDNVDQTLEKLIVDGESIYDISDWSSDGRWLLQLGEGSLILTAPEGMVQRLVAHKFASCTGAAWVNKVSPER